MRARALRARRPQDSPACRADLSLQVSALGRLLRGPDPRPHQTAVLPPTSPPPQHAFNVQELGCSPDRGKMELSSGRNRQPSTVEGRPLMGGPLVRPQPCPPRSHQKGGLLTATWTWGSLERPLAGAAGLRGQEGSSSSPRPLPGTQQPDRNVPMGKMAALGEAESSLVTERLPGLSSVAPRTEPASSLSCLPAQAPQP